MRRLAKVSSASVVGARARFAWLIAALPLVVAALVHSPSLVAGFHLEDRLQLSALERAPGDRPGALAPLYLWRFREGTAREITENVEHGWLEWYRAPMLEGKRMAFFRPLPSIVLQIEHRIFGKYAPPYHAVSLVLFIAIVAASSRLYRVLLSPRLAALATIIFATAAHHWESAGVICCLHILLATACGSLALLHHVAWREHGERRSAYASSLYLAGAALCGEAVVQVLIYFLAYEAFARREHARARAAALVPAATATAALVATHFVLGYGANDYGYTPLSRDGVAAFLRALPTRTVALWGEMLVGVPNLIGLPRPYAVACAIVVVCMIAAWARRGLPPGHARHARWLGVAAMFSVPPSTLGVIGSRYLTVPSLGAAVMLAVAIDGTWRCRSGGPRFRRLASTASCIFLALAHLIAAPLIAVVSLDIFRRRNCDLSSASEGWAARLSDLGVTDLDDVIALRVPPGFSAQEFRAVVGNRARIWPVAEVDAPLLATRVSPQSLELSTPPEHPGFCISDMAKSPTDCMKTGETPRQVGPFAVRAVGHRGGALTRIRLDFETTLDNPRLTFICWHTATQNLTVCHPPSTGEQKHVL